MTDCMEHMKAKTKDVGTATICTIKKFDESMVTF